MAEASTTEKDVIQRGSMEQNSQSSEYSSHNNPTDVVEKKESAQSHEVARSPDQDSKDSTVENITYSAQDFYHARAPDFKSRMQTFFYYRGMASMPSYLRRIYQNIPRTLYVNYDLPDEMKDEHGNAILDYPRNKIRTTKYTPLSFIPKNLVLQFTNVANFYFLIVVILGAFQLFGVASPGLAAVPLIVIVCITAIKDAIEDNRRKNSDMELNNSPIHLLEGLHNSNATNDEVSTWRKFKKSCTKGSNATGRGIKRFFIRVFGNKKTKAELIRKEVEEEDLALHRVSTIVSDYSFHSQARVSQAHSRQSRVMKKLMPDSLLNPELQKEDSNATNFKNRRWKDVKVGDFIRVRENEEVPADIVLLSSSDPEGNCYIETKNLDGETNLKNKNAPNCGNATHIKHARDISNLKFWLECDSPNAQLYSFRGTIHYEKFDEEGQLVNPDEKEAVNNNSVLLRGSTLRNTKWVVGVVVYTGQETKIMLNSGITPTKVSRISKDLNLSVTINFVVLFVLCFVSGLINGLFYDRDDVSRLYFELRPFGSTAAINGVILFFVTLIIYQSLVPISLYISVEIIKSFQAFLIYSDLKMYYQKLDFPCTPKSWNISDDLGQIEYIFSDKTGTLTQNVMEFKKCTINGKSYGMAYTEAKQGMDKRQGIDIVKEATKWEKLIKNDREEMVDKLRKHAVNSQLRDELVTFVSSSYVDDILTDSPQKTANERFMLALALCHTVVTEEGDDDSGYMNFKAESPDETALVSVSRDLGFVFNKRTRKTLYLDVYDERQEYELLHVIPFTSTRKRMSTVVRMPDNRLILHCKGADNVIYQRLDKKLNDDEVIHKTALHLEEYAKEGLRTLCIAEKELSPKHFEGWLQRYKEAQASLEEQEELMSALADEVEKDLVLLGGTAIEDRLQDGVPDAISILGDAGIKLWVLTGDRIETAINIGFSCNLLDSDMKLLVIRPDEINSIEHVEGLITKYLYEEFGVDTENNDISQMITDARADHSTPSKKFAVIIEGFALSLVFNDEFPDLQRKFLLLCKNCKSVICCRVSPAQKAQVTKLVKYTLDVMTLAIGDGANDVAMIQAANIGVGIAGEEGRQAVMSADYAVGQFRYLTRLLLVHGRWSYKRLAQMVPCFFYKNVVFTFTCFWFGIFNNFDGSYLYEYTFLMFYNLAFTSLPVIVLAILDQDVSDTVSLLVPQLYKSGILRQEWSQYTFVLYMIDGLYQSVVSFFFPYLIFYKSFQNPQGLTIDHRFWMGVVVACVSVVACDLYVLMQQYRWDWLSLLIDAISILLVFFWSGVWSSRVYSGEFYRAGSQILGTLACWCCIFIGTLICLLPRFTIDFLRRNFKPKDVDIIREQVRRGVYDRYPEGYDPTNKDDVEKFRLLSEIIDKDPEALDSYDPHFEKDSVLEDDNKLSKAFKTIKRRATLTKPRASSIRRHRRDTLNETFRKPINLNELRLQMIKDGELNSRASLERIDTTHQLPGLTQAETLISYHARSSINFER